MLNKNQYTAEYLRPCRRFATAEREKMKKSAYKKYKEHKSDSIIDMVMDKKLSIENLVDISYCIDKDPVQLGKIFIAATEKARENDFQHEDIENIAEIAINLAYNFCEVNKII